MRRYLLASLIVFASAAAVAGVMKRSVTGFTSATLPASSAWADGVSADPGDAEIAKLYCTYTTSATSTTGYAEARVQISADSGTTWNSYAVCEDDAAVTSETGLDSWGSDCYERVWRAETPGATATARQMPVLEFDTRGVTRFRVSGREAAAGSPADRGTFACTWIFAWTTR